MTRNRTRLDLAKVVKDAEPSLSDSSSPSFENVLAARLSRRDALRGGLGLATTTLFAGAGLSACDSDSDGSSDGGGSGSGDSVPSLSFNSIEGFSGSEVRVPEGYLTQILIPWGTPILGSFPAFKPDATNTAAEQAQQIGQNHDGMTLFPRTRGGDNSEGGLLVINHEYTNSTLYPGGSRSEDAQDRPIDADQVRKDINAHGVAVVELSRQSDGQWRAVNTGLNRRFTAASPMQLSGPAAGSPFMVTAYDNSGMTSRGTVNNCGRGYTPWGTYLACEEHIQGYLTTSEAAPPRSKARYGLSETGFGYLWSAVAGDPSEVDGEFARWDTTPTGADATQDYRNEANTFGWLVEIDPYDPSSTPRKRTAMGRFRHEGAQPGLIESGKRIAFYMGDDARGEYIYKFVTADAWDPDNPDADMLDKGTLYVARFDADGTGEWLPLDYATNAALAADFTGQADVLVNTRTAADVVGATPMDRPEWSTTDPVTGEIYFTLTNNTNRDAGETAAANPRGPNTHGHVIRFREDGDDPAATGFSWDIFVFGANANADPDFNISGLTLDNEFGSPDGLWFDPRGVLWIQTDNGAPLDSGTNDQMLAVIPAELSGDRTVNPDTQAQLKRFFVGPAGCEVTGVELTQDGRTLFVNIQHPGGDWPDGGGNPARSATIVLRREDGGELAL